MHQILLSLTNLGYVGAFIGGLFFVSIFTVAPATILLFSLSQTHPILWVAIAAGVGAVIGDLVIMSFLSQEFVRTKKHFSKEIGVPTPSP